MTTNILSRAVNVSQCLTSASTVDAVWRKRADTWLSRLPAKLPKAPRKMAIEDRAWRTNRMGSQPLHESYGQTGATRDPDDVRSAGYAGDLYAWLVAQQRPSVVVEFGAAFGVSGMYWLASLGANGCGSLYSFEINPEWATIAAENMAAIGNRFTLTVGAFEERVDDVLGDRKIDICLVDGIHTREFILRQYAILLPRMAHEGIILFDDIDFPSGDMREGWDEIWQRPEVSAACEINGHLGLVHLAPLRVLCPAR